MVRAVAVALQKLRAVHLKLPVPLQKLAVVTRVLAVANQPAVLLKLAVANQPVVLQLAVTDVVTRVAACSLASVAARRAAPR